MPASAAADTATPNVDERVVSKARAVRLLVCDVDGVLTDGQLRFHAAGDTVVEGKSFSILDGFGIRVLQETGIEVGLITGRRSPVVAHRAREMRIRHLIEGVDDKKSAWSRLLAELGLAARESAYVGDDWLDLPVMRACGLGIAVPNAPELVRRHADHVTEAAGGRGAVREVCELIMRAQGTLEARFAAYLEFGAAQPARGDR
jgi:3-deoxy-D-manno-octulosonate 8-phosphate phosphatase (KDO 8-P phosphatase)